MSNFLLGAFCMYLLSCTVACILELTNMVDIWTFGEIYFELPVFIICTPIRWINKMAKAIHDAKILRSFGFNLFGKLEQFDHADIETVKRIRNGVYNTTIRQYCAKILWKENEE